MAEQTLEQVVVSDERFKYKFYDTDAFLKQSFLKSAKFCVQIPLLTKTVLGADANIASEDMTFLCDAVDFPGQSLTATEFRIPGKLKLKVPYLREMNEVTLSFYHSKNLPIYKIFSDWVLNSSPTNTSNMYFDEIACPKINIIQFDEVTGIRGLFRDIYEFQNSPELGTRLSKYMTVQLINAIPLTVSSMPSNWADDGFHKLTVSFFYENLAIEMGTSNLRFQDLMDSGNIFDRTPNSPSTNPTSLDFFNLDRGRRNA